MPSSSEVPAERPRAAEMHEVELWPGLAGICLAVLNTRCGHSVGAVGQRGHWMCTVAVGTGQREHADIVSHL